MCNEMWNHKTPSFLASPSVLRSSGRFDVLKFRKLALIILDVVNLNQLFLLAIES